MASSNNTKLTQHDKKELALLVASKRICARTAERAVGMRGDGSGLLNYVKTVWGRANLTSPGAKALLEQYEKKWKARFPAISGSAPMPLAEPSGPTPTVPDLGKHSKKKSKVKRAAQLSAIVFQKNE